MLHLQAHGIEIKWLFEQDYKRIYAIYVRIWINCDGSSDSVGCVYMLCDCDDVWICDDTIFHMKPLQWHCNAHKCIQRNLEYN